MGKSYSQNPIVQSPASQPERRGNPIPLPRDHIEDWNDPSRENHLYKDGDVCGQCNALHEKDHWFMDAQRGAALIAAGSPATTVCPACKQINSHDPHGIVTLRGDYWVMHKDEILNLIHNEEQRTVGDNPLARIMSIREEDEHLIIETTNEALAQRIGKRVHSAHKGNVDYKWPNGNHLVRVDWERKLAA